MMFIAVVTLSYSVHEHLLLQSPPVENKSNRQANIRIRWMIVILQINTFNTRVVSTQY